MKKLLCLTLGIMLALITFASNVYATTYTFDSFITEGGYGKKTKVNDNITNMTGILDEEFGGYVGPYSNISKEKLADGITEETYVEVNLDRFKYGNHFEVSLAIKDGGGAYISEILTMSQKVADNDVKVTVGLVPNFEAHIKESGVYTYQWKMYTKDDSVTYAVFTVLKDDIIIGSTGEFNFDAAAKVKVSEKENVSVNYLWFVGIDVEGGLNVYAKLPSTIEQTPDPEKPAEQDGTPKTGLVDVALVSTVVAMTTLAGIVVVKKYNK